jgi:hypothetical protein
MELRIGTRKNGSSLQTHQSVEVVLHVRRVDIPWCNQYGTEICETLEKSILPRMFTPEIQDHVDSRQRIPELGLGGIPISVGDTTTTTSSEQHSSFALPKKKHKKSNHHPKKWTKKELVAQKKRLEAAERVQRKLQKDVFYADSEHLDMIYRLEPVPNGATLVLVSNENNNNNTSNHPSTQHYWQELEKLSKRIILWCYPTGTIFSETGELLDEGFLRPEMIPVASLFRAPKQLLQQEVSTEQQQLSSLGKEVIDVDENES